MVQSILGNLTDPVGFILHQKEVNSMFLIRETYMNLSCGSGFKNVDYQSIV
jgi:hypothetical protein